MAVQGQTHGSAPTNIKGDSADQRFGDSAKKCDSATPHLRDSAKRTKH